MICRAPIPSTSKTWNKFKTLVKSYLTALITFVEDMSDNAMLTYTLKHMLSVVSYVHYNTPPGTCMPARPAPPRPCSASLRTWRHTTNTTLSDACRLLSAGITRQTCGDACTCAHVHVCVYVYVCAYGVSILPASYVLPVSFFSRRYIACYPRLRRQALKALLKAWSSAKQEELQSAIMAFEVSFVLGMLFSSCIAIYTAIQWHVPAGARSFASAYTSIHATRWPYTCASKQLRARSC